MSRADQTSCLEFVVACPDCRRSSPEAQLPVLSMLRFLLSVAMPLIRSFFALADWQDHLQELVAQLLARLQDYHSERGALTNLVSKAGDKNRAGPDRRHVRWLRTAGRGTG